MKYGALLAIALILTVSLAAAAGEVPAKPGEADKCPVCGMFVSHYPDFLAQVVFKDGTYAFFCGVKDMMKYYFDLTQYNPSKKTADIANIVVTDYSTMKPLDGHRAYFVVGSVVFGPMGQEFFPFGEESAARDFSKENNGKEILRFEQITPESFKELVRKY
jgi:copper chaperone NosL